MAADWMYPDMSTCTGRRLRVPKAKRADAGTYHAFLWDARCHDDRRYGIRSFGSRSGRDSIPMGGGFLWMAGPAMTLTEEQRDAVAFDLEAARAGISHYRIENPSNVDTESALKELVDQANLAEDAIAEIERLLARDRQAAAAIVAMAEGTKQHVLKTQAIMKCVFDEADQLAGYCEELGNIVIAKDAKIADLETKIERLRPFEIAARDLDSDLTKIAGERDDQAARIKELEDAHKRSGAKYAKIINELRSSVYANIPGLDVGKIGPDAKPRSWQITEERKETLRRALEEYKIFPNDQAVLRAMLTEAGQ